MARTAAEAARTASESKVKSPPVSELPLCGKNQQLARCIEEPGRQVTGMRQDCNRGVKDILFDEVV